MKSINLYITEKLKINKDSSLEHINLKEGDKFSILSLYFNNDWDNYVHLGIYPLFTVKSIDDKKIIYKAPFHNNDINMDYYINSKGYYQHDDKDDRAKTPGRLYNNEIFLNPVEYKEILNLILKEKVFNPKYAEAGTKRILDKLVKEYFDNVNTKELYSREIKYYDKTHSGWVTPFTRPKELKEVISNHYGEY